VSGLYALIGLTMSKDVPLPFRLFLSIMMIVVTSFPIALLIGSSGVGALMAIVFGILIAFGLLLSSKWYVANLIKKQQ
jgi:bacteriorhodopsin